MKNFYFKPIPNPLKDNTSGHNMDHIYFDNNETFPFSPEENNYSPTNAWWLAEASFLAYCHPGFVRMAFYIAGFTEFRFFNGPGTECMVASSTIATIVTFRGTETSSLSFFHELATDLNTFPTPFPEGGMVHQGFLKGLDEVWEQKDDEYTKKNPTHNTGLHPHLQQLLKDHPDRPLWICGHSLGGALATLCFARIPEARGLYIYGAPRVGNSEFNTLIDSRPAFRIEHAGDPIPLVPPQIPSIDFNFQDSGQLVYLSRKGEISEMRPQLENWSGLESEKAFSLEEEKREMEIIHNWKNLPEDMKSLNANLKQIGTHVKMSFHNWADYLEMMYDEFAPSIEDHMPVYYVVKLWNLLNT
jgi:triacylglycerol lipase